MRLLPITTCALFVACVCLGRASERPADPGPTTLKDDLAHDRRLADRFRGETGPGGNPV
jgi:hypothetical protein